MAVPTFTKSGGKSTSQAKLDKTIFGVDIKNHQLMKDAYLVELSAARQNLAKTKSRGDVRGGGAKPWRQKGTGRARFGSSRNPIWEGGGVAFGPTGHENYNRGINAKAKKLAVRQALTLAAKEGKIVVIEELAIKDSKTKAASNLLAKLPVSGKILIVLSKSEDHLVKSLRNLANVTTTTAGYLSTSSVLNSDSLIFTSAGLTELKTRLEDKA